MAIITLATTKALLGITDTSKDTMIEARIPLVEAYVKKYTNDPMLDVDGLDDYPAGIEFPVSEMLRYDLYTRGKDNASSESLGDYSITYDFRTTSGYPDKILGLLKPYMKITFK